MKKDTKDVIFINIIGFVPEIGTIVFSPYFHTHKLLIEDIYKLTHLT